MLITHERQKLINSIIYFAKNTKYCGKVKLFKLLYFLDFEHFRLTGRSVTGLTYSAWKKGPVPVALTDEIGCPEPDFASAINIEYKETRFPNDMLCFIPLAEFDDSFFSKRELNLLKSLSDEYRNTQSDDIIEATHLENLPWDRVFNKEGKKHAEIPYEYALNEQEKEEMIEIIRERNEILKAIQ